MKHLEKRIFELEQIANRKAKVQLTAQAESKKSLLNLKLVS